MLVRLTSSKSGEMVMLAEHLRPLFDIMGKTGTARGIFTLEQLPEAIEKLRQAAEDDKTAAQEAERKAREEGEDEDEEGEDGRAEDEEKRRAGRNRVHLAQRAYPLIHLMELTQKEKGYIVWEAAKDF
ncbi:DUF1840 domain-containing protein [Propionivibrio soli]|uniref:DUF1840 domain-containing protein n=1 Tax=Propionivibrio soli TaxID=2976531 RepID=UPI0021E72B91|nr:DUF1840 domain-containing protein [Propionivibrio soli]